MQKLPLCKIVDQTNKLALSWLAELACESEITALWGYCRGMPQVSLLDSVLPKRSSGELEEKRRYLLGRFQAARVFSTDKSRSGLQHGQEPGVSWACWVRGCRLCSL